MTRSSFGRGDHGKSAGRRSVGLVVRERGRSACAGW